MKKAAIFFLVYLISIPLTGMAEAAYISIADMNEQKIARWTQSYMTEWREIAVDVQPQIPDVDSFPALTVNFAFWQPNGALLEDSWYCGTNDLFAIFSVGIGEPPIDTGAIVKKIRNKKPAQLMLQAPYRWDASYLPGCAITLGEALQTYHDLAAATGFDTTFQGGIENISVSYWIDEHKEPIPMSGYYDFQLWQQFYGIPVLGHALDGLKYQDETKASISPNFVFRKASQQSVDFCGLLMKEKELLAEDLPLCDFSVIRTALEGEINAGRLRRIFDINLGYVLYNTPGFQIQKRGAIRADPMWKKNCTYYAMPAWYVHCWYFSDPQKEVDDYEAEDVPPEGIIEYGALVFDAQTGQMLDRFGRDSTVGDYDGFLSWNAVGG